MLVFLFWQAAAAAMDGIINTVSANMSMAPYMGLLKPNGKMIIFFNEQARDSAYFIDKEERLQIRITGEVQKRILISQNYSCAIKDAR